MKMDSDACDICGYESVDILYDLTYTDFKNEKAKVVRCKACGLVYKELRNRATNIYHDGTYQDFVGDNTYFANCLLGYNEDRSEIKIFKDIVENVKSMVSVKDHVKPKILDAGCATGVLLDIFRKQGFDTHGIEANPGLAEYAKDKFKLNVDNCYLENADLIPNTYNVITMTDFIEHLDSPSEVLKRCHDLLSDSGILVVFTPNEAGILVRTADLMYKLGYHRPALMLHDFDHTYYFDKKTMSRLLNTCGFEIIKTVYYTAEPSRSNEANKLEQSIINVIESLAHLVNRSFRILVYARKI